MIFSLDLFGEDRDLTGESILLVTSKVGMNEALDTGSGRGISKSTLGIADSWRSESRDDSVDTVESFL
jgi:hypothetical protein